MRRHHRGSGGGTAYAKGNGTAIPDALSLIRTFNSEGNPARPMRPSPLTASTIQDMPLDLLDRIRSFPLFLSAPDSFLAAIGTHLRPQVHTPHDYILTEGDDAKSMYWLVRGAVAVTSRDGEATYAELRPGAFFGEIGILMDIPRTATIVARTKCLLVVLKKEDLRKELPKFPDVEQAIREEAQERLTILNKKKEESGRGTKSLLLRGGKPSHDSVPGEVQIGDTGIIEGGAVFNTRKRKSPSPSVGESIGASALADGLVNVRQLLKELPPFSNMPPDILHFLGLSAQPRTYSPFTNIIRQDSQGREIYFIVRGEVEVVDEKAMGAKEKEGKNGTHASYIKARLKAGEYFGEVTSLALAARRTATVRSISSVECLMISGEVLNELWTKCPPDIRKQLEHTARQRLEAGGDADIAMSDVDNTPAIKNLEITDRSPGATRRRVIPTVTFSHPKPASPHKPSRIEDREVIEPCDPDPFLNADLDSMRSRSRRGSLAPPTSESTQYTSTETSNGNGQSIPWISPFRGSHFMTPPEAHIRPKRPRIVQRRASMFGKGLLPDNLLVKIFSSLDLAELMRLRPVSTHWSKLVTTSPELMQHLDLSKFNRRVTDKSLMEVILPFIGSRPHTVDLSNCFHLTDEGFTALANQCSANVRCWKMKSVWDITAHAVLEMSNKAKGLEEIDLSNCRKVSDTLLARIVGWVVDEQMNIDSAAQRARLANGRTKAAQPAPAQLPPGTVVGCPKLKKLTLSYCKHVTDRSMAHLAVYASARLESIDLTRCTTITDNGFQHWSMYGFANLRKLCLADCTYLTDNAIVYLTNAAKGLRELDLVCLPTSGLFYPYLVV